MNYDDDQVKSSVRALSYSGQYLDDAFHSTQEACATLNKGEAAEKLRELRNRIRGIRQEIYGVAQGLQETDSH